VLNASGDLTISRSEPAVRSEADSALVRRAAERLASARRPAIIAGVGVAPSRRGGRALAAGRSFTSASIRDGTRRGAIPSDHPLAVGGRWTGEPRLIRFLTESDALLVIGSRLGAGDTAYWQIPLPPVIRIDADAAMVGMNYPAEVALVGDAHLTLAQLLTELEHRGP
jgi:acetolactate synthase-1/2/3 large subunit